VLYIWEISDVAFDKPDHELPNIKSTFKIGNSAFRPQLMLLASNALNLASLELPLSSFYATFILWLGNILVLWFISLIAIYCINLYIH